MTQGEKTLRQTRLSWTESTRQQPEAAGVDRQKGGVSAAAVTARQSSASRGKMTGTAWSDGSQSYESDAAESVTTSEAERIATEYENRQMAEEMDEQVQEALLERQQEQQRNAEMEMRQEAPGETAAGRGDQDGQEAGGGEEGRQEPPQPPAVPESAGGETPRNHVKPPETTILIAVKGSHIAIGSRGILVGRIGDAQGGIPALPCYE